MRIIVCLDDRGGMMFNRRRQSRDRVLIGDVVSDMKGTTLCISPYSESLFSGSDISLAVSENFLDEAGGEATCFVEDRALSPHKDQVHEMVIYRWNRHYPADFWCDLDPAAEGLSLIDREEFVGSSHDCITKETYRR